MKPVKLCGGRILKFGEIVYVVDKKVIVFEEGVYDLNDEESLNQLFELAELLYVAKWLPCYFGKDSVCFVMGGPDGSEDKTVSIKNVNSFSGELKTDMLEGLKYVTS